MRMCTLCAPGLQACIVCIAQVKVSSDEGWRNLKMFMVLSVRGLQRKAVTLLFGGRQEVLIYLFTIFLQLPKNNNLITTKAKTP